MPIKVSWYDPGKILLETYSGEVSDSDLRLAMQETLKHFQDSPTTIHVIVDWRTVVNTPNFTQVFHEGAQLLRHEHMGYMVIVGLNLFVSYWVQVIGKIANFKWTHFDTIDEAATFLYAL